MAAVVVAEGSATFVMVKGAQRLSLGGFALPLLTSSAIFTLQRIDARLTATVATVGKGGTLTGTLAQVVLRVCLLLLLLPFFSSKEGLIPAKYAISSGK